MFYIHVLLCALSLTSLKKEKKIQKSNFSKYHEKHSYYKYCCYVPRSVFFFFGHIAAGLFLLQETLLQLNVMEHMCPLSGVASSTVGL